MAGPSLGVLLTGPLEVLTRGGPLLQPVWRPRYVVLTTTALHYYLRGGSPSDTTASKLLAGDGLVIGDGGLFGHHRGSIALGDVDRVGVEDGVLSIHTKGSTDKNGEGEASPLVGFGADSTGRSYSFRGGDCAKWRQALEQQRGRRFARSSTITGDYRGAGRQVLLVTAFEASGREFVVAHEPHWGAEFPVPSASTRVVVRGNFPASRVEVPAPSGSDVAEGSTDVAWGDDGPLRLSWTRGEADAGGLFCVPRRRPPRPWRMTLRPVEAGDASVDVTDVDLAVDAAMLAVACEATSILPAVTSLFAAAADLDAAKVLDACDAFLGVLAALGPAMALGVKDFRSNAAKARKHARPSLGDSLRAERSEDVHKPKGILKDPSVAIGFLWLRRTLAFQVAINRYALETPESEPISLSAAARRAYADELEPAHGWLLRGIFNTALSNVPAWDNYLVAVAPQVPAEYRRAVVRRDLADLNAALLPLLAAWKQLFVDLDLEDLRKV